MTSRDTQPTTTATDPSHEHADDPSPKEINREGGDAEDPQTKDPQTETKTTQTQPVHIDAGPGQPERQDGADDDEEEEKEEPEEEPEDGPPIPKWRIRGPTNFGVSRGGNSARGGRGRGYDANGKPLPPPKPKPT